jgi:hypothetical protein
VRARAGRRLAQRGAERGGLGRAWATLRLLLGLDTGAVLEWGPEAGWREVPGTRSSGPNGVEISSDGEQIFFAAIGSGELVRVRRAGDPAARRIEIEAPDNLTWMRDGRLLVASHRGPLRALAACGRLERGACPLGFGILAVEPETLAAEELLAHEGAPIGAVSVALEVGDELFLGALAGNRIARLARPPGPPQGVRARSSP